jgi:drug/metabolite transporter (DMT)-like permease
MGMGAVLLWSLSAACTVSLGKRLGVWQYLAITALTAGLLQMAGYIAMGRRLRTLVRPPPKLWIAAALGFVAYLLLYTTALVMARSEAQAVGVSLMNYLWPTFAMLFTAWLVPGERIGGRRGLAMLLSLAGILLANGRAFLHQDAVGNPLLPYLLGAAAAAAWALYCALISRWRHWAKDYAAAPLGLLAVGTLAAGMCLFRGEWRPLDGPMWGIALLAATGPWAGGYMLWERALHRASGVTLGLIAAATPILSTLCLFALFAATRANPIGSARVAALLAASVLIAVSVALGRTASRKPCRTPIR